jgi:hypothetical protein
MIIPDGYSIRGAIYDRAAATVADIKAHDNARVRIRKAAMQHAQMRYL